MTSGNGALGQVVVEPGSDSEVTVAVHDRLFIGRECAGIEERLRLVLADDETISRNHCELRLEPAQDRALIMDTSTNGTRLNGTRIERAVPVPIRSGDRIQIGSVTLEFRASGFSTAHLDDSRETVRNVTVSDLVLVVGDVVGYSTVAEQVDSDTLMGSMDVIYGELRRLLTDHRGTLNNYVGDAFFASWDLDHDPGSAERALSFALDASSCVREVTPGLDIRYADGKPLHFGWAATEGRAAVRLLTGAIVTVLGDSANLAFRMAGLAGRDGHPDVLVAHSLHELTKDSFSYGPPTEVRVKGREAAEMVYGLRSPAA